MRRVMRFGGFTGVGEGHQDLKLVSGSPRAAYVLGAQREGVSHKRKSTIRGRRPLDDRRPGPLVEVNRLSDVDLLRDLDRIVDFDAKVAHGALDLGMSKQELDRTQVAGTAIDQHRLRAP